MPRITAIALAVALFVALDSNPASAGSWRDGPLSYDLPPPAYDYHPPPPVKGVRPAYRYHEPPIYDSAPPRVGRYYRSCDFVYDNHNGYTPCRRR